MRSCISEVCACFLVQTELPAGMRVVRVRGGQACVAGSGGQYRAQLTLVPAPRDDVVLAKYQPPGEAEEPGGEPLPLAGTGPAQPVRLACLVVCRTESMCYR
jgi:hypothetical protein